MSSIFAVIPALNEELAIGQVIADLTAWVDGVIVVDNGSTDQTADIARTAGAHVVSEPRRGYGRACLAGVAALPSEATIVVFLDGDRADDPRLVPELVRPIREAGVDLVIGSRVLGTRERGALAPIARFGNWLATTLIRWLFGHRFTDLGPFRAISRTALDVLGMRDPTFGWTVEMQVRAVKRGLRIREIPVPYRKRIGRSKISGTVVGSVRAGAKILITIFGHRLGWIR